MPFRAQQRTTLHPLHYAFHSPTQHQIHITHIPLHKPKNISSTTQCSTTQHPYTIFQHHFAPSTMPHSQHSTPPLHTVYHTPFTVQLHIHLYSSDHNTGLLSSSFKGSEIMVRKCSKIIHSAMTQTLELLGTIEISLYPMEPRRERCTIIFLQYLIVFSSLTR